MVDGAVLVLFAVWWAASAIAQVRRPRCQAIRRWDVIGLLPASNFFAPRPIMADFEVRYRGWTSAEGFGPWRTLPVPRPRHWTDALVNPGRREKKAMFDACVRVLRSYSVHHRDDAAVMISMSYILLLGAASAVAEGDGVQYTIWITDSGREDARAVFRSALHRRDARLVSAHS